MYPIFECYYDAVVAKIGWKGLLPGFPFTGSITMNEYDIKRGHFEKIEGDKLETLMKDTFGRVKKKDGKLLPSFGALEYITADLQDKKTLVVETKMNTDVDDKMATETIRMYNQFLERATGFSAKERRKRTSKK